MKIITFTAKDVKLINEGGGDLDPNLALASISFNPNVTWVKFILTDDKPNSNGHRVPKEEFANVKKTAVYMPLKMASGEIKVDHDDASPLGVMAHVTEKDNHIEVLAALWNKEREQDIALIKERFANGLDVDVSWEISYDDAKANADLGCEDLLGCSVNAATIVGIPAYKGRTPITQMASLSSTEDNPTMDVISLDEHKKLLGELETKLASDKEAAIKDVEKSRDDALAAVKEQNEELESLRAFKKEYDDAKAKVEKVASIKNRFKEAGLEMEETYFTEREDKLAALDEAQLEFLVQELVSFKKPEANASDEKKDKKASLGSGLPNLGAASKEVDQAEIVTVLRSLDKKAKKTS